MNATKHEIAFKKPYTALGDSAVLSRQARRATSGGLPRLEHYKINTHFKHTSYSRLKAPALAELRADFPSSAQAISLSLQHEKN